jgi:hypothetical protein
MNPRKRHETTTTCHIVFRASAVFGNCHSRPGCHYEEAEPFFCTSRSPRCHIVQAESRRRCLGRWHVALSEALLELKKAVSVHVRKTRERYCVRRNGVCESTVRAGKSSLQSVIGSLKYKHHDGSPSHSKYHPSSSTVLIAFCSGKVSCGAGMGAGTSPRLAGSM